MTLPTPTLRYSPPKPFDPRQIPRPTLAGNKVGAYPRPLPVATGLVNITSNMTTRDITSAGRWDYDANLA